MKYDVISTRNFEGFKEIVNQKIKEGWKPLGGVNSYVDEDGYVWYLQSIIKE